MDAWRWVAGLAFAIIVGAAAVGLFSRYLRALGKIELPPSKMKRVPPVLTGIVERASFALVVAFEFPDATTSMIAWLALKLAANWGREGFPDSEDRKFLRFAAILQGLISMIFAMLGGLICRGDLWL